MDNLSPELSLIPLTKGKKTIVDKIDFEYINQWKWSATRNRYGWTATRGEKKNGKYKVLYLHREIMKCRGDVDHIDRDQLNNSRKNLRECTKAQNNYNSGPKSKRKIKGIFQNRLRWRAEIRKNGKRHHLGCFASANEAAFSYNLAAKRYFGDFAFLNKLPIKNNA